MQSGDRGSHGGKRDVSTLDVDHHGDLLALQASGDDRLVGVMVGKQFTVAVVCETPGLGVVPEGAAPPAFEVDAPVGHSDVPVTLSQHLPGVDAGGEASSGQHLRGFCEACGLTGVVHLGGHPLHCLEVVGDLEQIVHSVQV